MKNGLVFGTLMFSLVSMAYAVDDIKTAFEQDEKVNLSDLAGRAFTEKSPSTSGKDDTLNQLEQLEVEVDEAKSEVRARGKIYMHFYRQHKRMVRRIDKILEQYSEEDLRYIFASYSTINTGNVINGESIELEIGKAFLHGSSIRSLLEIMTSESYQEKMVAELDREITRSGSAKKYLKNLKHKLNINWCLFKQVSEGIMILPASVGGIIGLAILTGPVFLPVVVGGVGVAAYLAVHGVLNNDCKFKVSELY